MNVSNDLTAWDDLLLFTHSVWIDTESADSVKAQEETHRRFGAADRKSGSRRDAFHRCYWSALLARDLDSASAFALANVHEAAQRHPPKQRAMNLHNSREGILIGEQNGEASDTELADLCDKTLRAGRLKLSPREGSADPLPVQSRLAS